MRSAAGTEHSHWVLWGTWRRGPDLVAHIAAVVAEHTGMRHARVEVHFRDDVEVAKSDNLGAEITGQGLRGFSAIFIEGGEDTLRARVAFVRRPTEVCVGAHEPRRALVRAGVVLEVTSSEPRTRRR
jgi:hypothetical protein